MGGQSVTWCKIDSLTSSAVCERCGQSKPIPLPMAITKFVAWSDAFMREHRDCKPLDPSELAALAAGAGAR